MTSLTVGPDATLGELKAGVLTYAAQTTRDPETFQRAMATIRAEELWRRRWMPDAGRFSREFASFAEFATSEPPDGLGIRTTHVWRLAMGF
jgi:hypothetical protein